MPKPTKSLTSSRARNYLVIFWRFLFLLDGYLMVIIRQNSFFVAHLETNRKNPCRLLNCAVLFIQKKINDSSVIINWNISA
jgi:hypothetical protein